MVRVIKKREIGIVGALIVFAQAFGNFQNSKTSTEALSKEIQTFKEEFNRSLVDREEYFVRKTEIVEMSAKIDKLTQQLAILTEKVTENLEASEYDDGMIYCSLPMNHTHRRLNL